MQPDDLTVSAALPAVQVVPRIPPAEGNLSGRAVSSGSRLSRPLSREIPDAAFINLEPNQAQSEEGFFSRIYSATVSNGSSALSYVFNAAAGAATNQIVARTLIDGSSSELLKELTGSHDFQELIINFESHLIPLDILSGINKEQVLLTILANIAKQVAEDEIKNKTIVSTAELSSRMLFYLLEEIENAFLMAEIKASERGEEYPVIEVDFLSTADEIIEELLPCRLKILLVPKLVAALYKLYLSKKLHADIKIEDTVQSLKTLLMDPTKSVSHEEVKISNIVSFSNSIANEILVKTEEYLKSKEFSDSITKSAEVEHFSALMQQVSTILFTSDKYTPIFREKFHSLILRLCLKGIANLVRNVKADKPALSDDQLLFEVINRVIRLFRDLAPQGEAAKLPTSWNPLSQALIYEVFPDLVNDIPLPRFLREYISNKIIEDILPGKLAEWSLALNLFVNKKEENKKRLDKTFGGNNHASEFCRVMGIWTRDYIPRLLTLPADLNQSDAGRSIVESLISSLNLSFSDDSISEMCNFVSGTLNYLAQDFDTTNASEHTSPFKSFCEKIGEFSEGFLLQLAGELFSQIKEVDDALQQNNARKEVGDGTIVKALANKIIPVVADFYTRVSEIKSEQNETKISQVSIRALVEGLQRGPNLLNSGFPTHEHETLYQKNQHRIQFFTRISKQILEFSHISVENSPFPSFLRVLGINFLTDVVFSRSLLALEGMVLNSREKLLYKGFVNLKDVARNVTVKAPAPSAEPVPELSDAAKAFNEDLGGIVYNLLGLFSNHPGVHLLEIEQLRTATKDSLGKLVSDSFNNVDLFDVLKNQIKETLPDLVEGYMDGEHTRHIEMKPRAGTLMHGKFDAKIEESKKKFERELFKVAAEALMCGLEELVIKAKVKRVVSKIEDTMARGFNWMAYQIFDRLINLCEIFTLFFVRRFKPENEARIQEAFDNFRPRAKEWLDMAIEVKGSAYDGTKKFVILVGEVLFMIPYQIFFRQPAKLYFWFLVKKYHKELEADFHEDVFLNVLEKVINTIIEEFEAFRSSAGDADDPEGSSASAAAPPPPVPAEHGGMMFGGTG